jgi:hypothetical protein
MQYSFLVAGGQIQAWVEYWGVKQPGEYLNSQTGCTFFSNNSRNGGCCAGGDCCSGSCQTQIPVYPYAPNTLPVDTSVSIGLISDPTTGNVTEAGFNVVGNASFSVPIPANFQLPIQSFQFVAVGLDNQATATFNPGTTGTISYEVGYGQNLCVNGAKIACPGGRIYSGATGEMSNATYGVMSSCCGLELSQTLAT